MMHQRHRSSSPKWRNPLALGILLSGACVILMITEVDSADSQRYRVIRWEGVNYHKTPTEYDWVYEGSGKDLKKDATFCATPVAGQCAACQGKCPTCERQCDQAGRCTCALRDRCRACEGTGRGSWVKVTENVPEKGSYLPIRVPNIVRGHFVKVLELVGESHGSALNVTGTGLMDGCYVLRKAEDLPGPYNSSSQWNFVHHGQWYERQHDGAFIYYGRAKNSGQSFHRWCIFSKHNVCMYFADTDCDEISKIPAGGWSRPWYRPQPKDKVTVVVS